MATLGHHTKMIQTAAVWVLILACFGDSIAVSGAKLSKSKSSGDIPVNSSSHYNASIDQKQARNSQMSGSISSSGYLSIEHSSLRGKVSIDQKGELTDAGPVAVESAIFFSCNLGKDAVFANFELHSKKELGNCVLRRLPSRFSSAANLKIRATVSGGACGEDDTTVEFGVNAATLNYFRLGRQSRWQPLSNPKVISGKVTKIPNKIWTGSGSNRGWILWLQSSDWIGSKHVNTFASSYSLNYGWDVCTGNALTSGETVTLTYIYSTPR
eukprot:gnl/TRDRNA2_/TRDRNA2_60234_c1_seq1.p1 gnl/TRDRNA2_/TRDRNA2_60234_c1~~gnl/TRDRNA2_/TRDRNA2_60234_c1_seq1.p1  ORF type:complete len:269 (+),score=16.92 gnl/TRDRNA2_/TRDRNA2_60234_c1_seq1:43-849(+)